MKRILAIVLTLVLVMSVFIGCTKKEEAPKDDGKTVVKPSDDKDDEADVVTTASIVNEGQGVVNGLKADGTWIVATLNDTTTDQDILVEGQFHDKNDTTKPLYRKLALYTQDENHTMIDSFKLTAPKMIVRSENFKIQGGTFIGDVYVEANGFNLSVATVEGNVYYAKQEYMDSAVIEKDTSKVTGKQEVKAAQ